MISSCHWCNDVVDISEVEGIINRLTAAFTEYTSKKVKKAEKTERPSVLAKLSQFKEMVKNAVVDRTKRKELER